MAIINTRINLRNDSTANWLANGTALLVKGEVGIEFLDSGKTKIKIGDGVTPWSDLKYFDGGSIIEAIDKNVLVLKEGNLLSLAGFNEAEVGTSPIKSENGQIIWVKSETSEIKEEIESLVEITSKKVDIVYSEIDGEQVPWTLLSPENSLKLDSISQNAQENVIEAICVAGTAKPLAIVNKTVQIPFATGSIPGLVKLSKEISIDENQSLQIREVNVNKLVQTKGEEIYLRCGDANI